MKRPPCALIGCAGILALSLWLARIHPFGNAGLYAASASRQPIPEHASLPPDVRATLVAKCADCHSNEPRTPLYARFAPVSWLMERDILKARAAMNLSRWDSYTPEEQEAFRVKVMLEARSHKMPPPQYRAIHWNARITDTDIQVFDRWAKGVSLAGFTPVSLPSEGDADRGRTIFEKRCTGCHAVDQNREGPHLRGVFGRTSGEAPNFTYSTALKNAHIVWNETTLDQWLTDPDTLVPGNNMEFHVPKPQERQDLIRFLRDTLSK